MRETKTEAKTIQDAVEKGLAEMGLRRDQVEVVVVSEGTTGFLGFGAKKACVILREKRWNDGRPEEPRSRGGRSSGGRGGGRGDSRGPRRDGRGPSRDSSGTGSRSASAPARRPGRYGYEDARLPPPQQAEEHHHSEHRSDHSDRPSRGMERSRDRVYTEEPLGAEFLAIEQIKDPVEHAKTALLKMTSLMGMEAKVTEARLEAGENLLFIRFECADSTAFTEDNGRGLQALQFVLNSIVSRRREPHLALRLDTGGYWDSKEKELARMVEDAVKSVKANSAPCRLEPMPASMRKMVHNIVKASYPGIETSSEGEGRWRKVVIRSIETAAPAPEAAPVAEAKAPVAAPVMTQAAEQAPATEAKAPEAEVKTPEAEGCSCGEEKSPCCGGDDKAPCCSDDKAPCCGGEDKSAAEKTAEEQPLTEQK